MESISCKYCGKIFKSQPSNYRKYCSIKCSHLSSWRYATVHGMSRTRLYTIWSDLKARCSNENVVGYEYYGERGIKVCNEWSMSFESFYLWAMNNEYKEHLKLDRIKVNGDYEPSNCRWVTHQQQMMNTRKRKRATSKYKGVSWCSNVSKWRAQINLNGKTIHLGLFHFEEVAACVYDRVARREFKEFANTNF